MSKKKVFFSGCIPAFLLFLGLNKDGLWIMFFAGIACWISLKYWYKSYKEYKYRAGGRNYGRGQSKSTRTVRSIRDR